jgi:hypothetical protein
MFDYSEEFKLLAAAYEASGGVPDTLKSKTHGLMVVSGNTLLGRNEVEGLIIDGQSMPDGVKARVLVKKGTILQNPVHLCFGVIPSEGVQRILADFIIEEGAHASFIAHCTFPNALKVTHIMEGTVKVEKSASMDYSETHYHGLAGGVEVLPTMKINVAEGGSYTSTFKLIKGTAGLVRIDYAAHLAESAVAELYAKIFGKGTDDIQVKESIYLDGQFSRGLAKSRIVVSEHAKTEVLGEIIGAGKHSRGHVDCTEIVQGNGAKASAIPRLFVVEESAKLTHEAAIGNIDRRQMETLMARGLSEREAADVIVAGILR